MKNGLKELRFYQISLELWENCWSDTGLLMKDIRGKEIARQLIRSCGSISANIEEGFGRGTDKEYPHFLGISRGSAQESRGWYQRSKFLLSAEIILNRCNMLDSIIAMITKTIETLGAKNK